MMRASHRCSRQAEGAKSAGWLAPLPAILPARCTLLRGLFSGLCAVSLTRTRKWLLGPSAPPRADEPPVAPEPPVGLWRQVSKLAATRSAQLRNLLGLRRPDAALDRAHANN